MRSLVLCVGCGQEVWLSLCGVLQSSVSMSEVFVQLLKRLVMSPHINVYIIYFTLSLQLVSELETLAQQS